MTRLVLDTSELIRHWNRCWRKSAKPVSPALVDQWAQKLIRFYDTNAVVTPVVIEFLAGFTSSEQLQLAKHFLRLFEYIDEQKITPADWNDVLRIAQRIPRDGKPRQMGDCLIRAITRRLRCDVQTCDKHFPR